MHIDLVLLARTVHTLDPERPTAEAVAVADGTIVAVGTRAEAAGWDLAEARVLDLGDAVVVPGFVDAHTHPLKGAVRRWGTVDLAGAASPAELRERIAAVAATKPADAWVLGHSLELAAFAGDPVGTESFEDAFGGRPGYLLFGDAHSLLANRRALELAGVTGERDFGNASRVVVDDAGVPTGYLIEDAMALVARHVPALSFDERTRAVRAALDGFAAAGFTGVHQLNLEEGDLELLRSLEDDGDLPVRLRISPFWRSTDDGEAALRSVVALQGTAGRRWHVEGVKLMLDGTVEHGSAWLREADADGGGLLPLWTPPQRYTDALHALASRGIPTATHAIGDRAVEHVLNSVATAPVGGAPVAFRIEHVETLPDDLVGRFAELGVAASMQPAHMLGIRADGTDEWSRRLGAGSARASHAWRMRDLLESGATVALGSDWPVVDSDPRGILAAATTRRAPGSAEGPVGPSQRLSVAAALRGLTQQVWASIGRPHDGLIRPGSVADFTVLDGDPLTASPDELLRIPVLLTIVGGTEVAA